MQVDSPTPAGKPERSPVSATTELPLLREGVVVGGRYKLLEQLAEGGMGSVWVAEQFQPVRRRVAIKLIKAGMDSKQVLSRFEVERQALALMDHPNIAKVLDGGMTEQGRPFFVMEYVKGVPITEFCDSAKLTVRERLKLLVPVCQAVQHAHQKGIIHRDLKPSNILVCLYDGQPVPKVIDFGLAKAMHQPLTEHTVYTAHGLMVGTPMYMSPEQAEFNNLDVDTRTDVYSLGVILYELLTGSTPLERGRFKDAAWQEILRIIKEEEPQKPSTRISGSGSLPAIAAQRRLEPSQLCRAVKGDLDWIVMKSLEKERSRRYDTANGLARDLDRFLSDEPVEARPPSLGYKLSKLARRNKRALATAALLLIVVVGALVVAAGSVGWVVRDHQTRQAVVERNILAALDETKSALDADQVADALAALRHAETLGAGSETAAAIADRVRQWRTDLTMVQRLAVIPLERPAFGAERLELEQVDDAYQSAFRDYGIDLDQFDPAEVAGRIQSSPIGKYLIEALDDWAIMQDGGGISDEETDRGRLRGRLLGLARDADRNAWRNLVRDAIDRNDVAALSRLASQPELQEQRPLIIVAVAQRLRSGGQTDQAIQILRAAHDRRPSDFWFNLHLASHLLDFDAYEAVGYLRTCMAQRPADATVRVALAIALFHSEYPKEAASQAREAIRLQPTLSRPHYELGRLLEQEERYVEAENEYRQAIRLNPNSYLPCRALRGLLLRHKRLADAEAAFREAIKSAPHGAPAYMCLGDVLIEREQWQDAQAAYAKAIEHNPSATGVHQAIAQTFMQHDQGQFAVEHLMRGVAARPGDDLLALQAATLQLRLGHEAEYRELCRRLLTANQGAVVPRQAFRTAKACLLAEPPEGDLKVLTRLADLAVAEREKAGRLARHYAFVRALAACRAADWAAVTRWCEEGRSGGVVGDSLDASFSVLEALVQHHAGNQEEALSALAQARSVVRNFHPHAPKRLGAHWADWSYFDILHRQAGGLITGGGNLNDRRQLLQRGLWYASDGDADRALADLKRALASPAAQRPEQTLEQSLAQAQQWLNAGEYLRQHQLVTESTAALLLAKGELEALSDKHPDSDQARRSLANSHVRLGSNRSSADTAASEEHFAQALAINTDAALQTHASLANSYINEARWDDGWRHLSIVLDHQPENHLLAMQVAVFHLYRGDSEKHAETCHRLLDRYGQTNDPIEADRTAKACLLSDPPIGELSQLTRLSEVAVQQGQSHEFYHYFPLIRALAAYRSADWEETSRWCAEGRKAAEQWSNLRTLESHYAVIQAMAAARKGNQTQARELLDSAANAMRELYPQAPKSLGSMWADWQLYEVLRRQAEQILATGGPP